MDVREKLVELLNEVQETGVNEIQAGFGCAREYVTNEKVVSHLIANGVTVQEWIPAKDRLPEIVSTHKRYRSTINKSIRVLCVCVQNSGKTMVKDGYCEWRNDYPEPIWKIPGAIDEVTHWMPLPQPPKGD